MAPISTPNGMQSGTDALEVTYSPGYNLVWEQNGTARTAGYVDESLNPDGFFTWKKARSDDNKNNHGGGP
jgi:hypothetical protein